MKTADSLKWLCIALAAILAAITLALGLIGSTILLNERPQENV